MIAPMLSLLEWSREGLRDEDLFDTGILAETSLFSSLGTFPCQTSLRDLYSQSNCLYSYPTVSHLSEHDQGLA